MRLANRWASSSPPSLGTVMALIFTTLTTVDGRRGCGLCVGPSSILRTAYRRRGRPVRRTVTAMRPRRVIAIIATLATVFGGGLLTSAALADGNQIHGCV